MQGQWGRSTSRKSWLQRIKNLHQGHGKVFWEGMDGIMILECCLRHKERRAGKKSCRWSAITATLLAICFGILKIFVSYEEFSLPKSCPPPQFTHLFLHFPSFWSVSDIRMIQKSSQSSLSTWPSSLFKQYKPQKALILSNMIFHEKMAWIHWILK